MEAVHLQIRKALSRTPSASEDLHKKGYAVIDGVFDIDTLQTIREEIELLESAEWLQASPSLLKLPGGKSATLVKQGIRERSLVLRGELSADEATLSMVPTLASFWEGRTDLVDTLKQECDALKGLTSLDQVKVAVIRNHGCFPVHTDTDPSTGRSLSATIYLNEGYKSSDGGELRVYEYPYGHADVAPIFGRMVRDSAVFHAEKDGAVCHAPA
jgi:Rps23 Pro-64 3,4-dihydroxylase Tpa1-like proline 4-hydroxylase